MIQLFNEAHEAQILDLAKAKLSIELLQAKVKDIDRTGFKVVAIERTGQLHEFWLAFPNRVTFIQEAQKGVLKLLNSTS